MFVIDWLIEILMMQKRIFGSTRLSLSYTDEELDEKVSSYVDMAKDEFTYNGVCGFIRERAKEEGKFQKEANTIYDDIELFPIDASRISRVLWQKIWNREIFIDFNKDPFHNYSSQETFFCKVKNDE